MRHEGQSETVVREPIPRDLSIPSRSIGTVQILQGGEALDALKSDWERLFRECPGSRPSSSFEWNQIWWQELAAKNRGDGVSELVIFTYRDSFGRLVGVVPCHFKAQLGRIGPKSRYPIGLKLLMPLGVLDHRDLYSFTEEASYLIVEEHLTSALETIFKSAMSFLTKRGLDGFLFEVDDPERVKLLNSIGTRNGINYIYRVKSYEGSHVLALPEDWKFLRNSLSKSMKDKISYSPRFIERNGHAWEVDIHRDLETACPALDSVMDLHRLRADAHQGKQHNNYFHHPHQRSFLTALVANFCASGNAFVASIKIDGKVVGAQLFFQFDKELLVTYSGFDPSYHKFSPLFVLISEVLKDAILRGVESVNFLVSGEQHQTRWGAHPISTRHRYFFIKRRPKSLARFGAFVWARNHRAKLRERQKRAADLALAKPVSNPPEGD